MTTTADNRMSSTFRAGLWAWQASFLGETTRKGILSLADQAIVSGTRFLTTVIVGRSCGADELGVYALGFSSLVFLTALQESLITTPYAIFNRRQTDRERQQYAGSLLVHHAVVALLAIVVFAALGAIFSRGLDSSPWAPMLWVLAASLPFALLREFARRFAFAHLHVAAALTLDIVVAVVQLGGLILLAVSGTLSAPAALLVMGVACALAGSVWLYAARRRFVPRRRDLLPHLARNWSFGKWIFGSQTLPVISGYSIYWLLSILISTTATGIYAACATVVMLANPFILGLCNILEPKTAHALADGGKRELLRVVRKVTLLLGLFLSVFWLATYFLGERIVALLYDNPVFAHQGHTITVLSTALVAAALGVAYSYGLKATENPQWDFFASLVNLVVMLLTAVPLAWSFGIVGGAYCLLCGSAAGTVTRYLAFSHAMGTSD